MLTIGGLSCALLLGWMLSAKPARAAEAPWNERLEAVSIPMRDGKALVADVFLPSRPGAYPTILIQTPYGRQRWGAAMPDVESPESPFDREQYAIVVVDWRGFYDSRPAGEGVAQPRRGEDGYDVVEWIARQPWSNGKVGTWGPSALGRIQFLTAQQQPPHLVCCVPIVAGEGATYDDYYENGVYRKAHVRLLDRLGFAASRRVSGAPHSGSPVYRLMERVVEPARLNVPMLLITGWFDHGVRSQLRTFRALKSRAGEITRRETRLVVGPWHHTAIGEARQGELEFPGAVGERDRVSRLFFDYWLRGLRENGWEDEPTYRWWQMGEERWLSAADAASIRVKLTPYTAHADGTLDTRPPGADEDARRYLSDPRNPVRTHGGANVGYGTGGGLGLGPLDQCELERREDVLVYTTPVLEAPLRLYGAVTIHLSFAIDAKDASFAARLCDVYPDGRSLLITDGITRAKYREGAERAVPVEPGKVYSTTFSLPPTAITLPPGHRLRLSLCGSNWPRFERNPQTGEDHYAAAEAVAARCTLYHDAARPTTLTLPVLRSP